MTRRQRRATWVQDLFDGLTMLVLAYDLAAHHRRQRVEARRPIEPIPARVDRPDPSRRERRGL